MTKAQALAIVNAPASAEVREATADRFIAGKSAHALLALIGSAAPLPNALTAQDIGAADTRRTARKAAAAAAAAA
jgi:hypothetical protein